MWPKRSQGENDGLRAAAEVFAKVCARSAALFTLGFRSKEAVRSVRAQLYGDLQPHPSFGQRDGRQHYCPEHAANRRRRTAHEYNERKGRQGAFWEDRYHATAIETGKHLHHCLVYIDLNMVRAGRGRPSRRVVAQW